VRDLSLLVLLGALAGLAWWRPWLGVLGLAFLDVMHPQGYAAGFMREFPVFLLLFVVVVAATARDYWRGGTRPALFLDWRIPLLLLLWGWFAVTTSQALNPWAAWPKLIEIGKQLPPLLLVLLLIDNRQKLLALNLVMALSIAVVVLKGGYWAVTTGFHDRVYGPPGSQYADNNEFAVAVAMGIPLLALWYRQAASHGLRLALAGAIVLGFAAALSSWSRGGMLSVAAVAFLLVWHSRRKWLALPLLLAGVGLVYVAFPEQWLARMAGLGAGEIDASARSRLEVWRLGWAHAQAHPLFGGGFQGWVYLSLPTGWPLDWHSAYVEMAAEHGFVGLGLWLGLLLGSLLALTRLIWLGRHRRQPWLADHAAMLRASLAAYAVGAAFLGIAYWQLLYLLLASAILLARCAREPGMPSRQSP
jgi:putative inorganic carbon (hco3(-)) transporter